MKKHTYVYHDKYDILYEPDVDVKPIRAQSRLIALSGVCFYAFLLPMFYLATTSI